MFSWRGLAEGLARVGGHVGAGMWGRGGADQNALPHLFLVAPLLGLAHALPVLLLEANVPANLLRARMAHAHTCRLRGRAWARGQGDAHARSDKWAEREAALPHPRALRHRHGRIRGRG